MSSIHDNTSSSATGELSYMKGGGEARGFYLESLLYKSYMSHLFKAAVLNDHQTLCPAARQILHCFANKNLLLFCRSPSVAVVVDFVLIQK